MTERTALGEFLRARRARLRPADVGLPTGTGLRRTPGLRREEIATFAGISIDYYTRLEQGKETRPGTAVIDALARALRLDDEELGHLRALAAQVAQRAPEPRPAPSRAVRPTVRQLLETIRPSPAYVLSRCHDVLAANRAGLRLLAGIESWPARQRNTMRYMFLHPAARELFLDWERVAGESVANLHVSAGTDPDAPDVTALVGELIVKSEDFARMWKHYDVRAKAGGQKRYHHPVVGDLTLSYEVLALARTEGQQLVVYQAAPGSPDHDAMVLLDLAEPAVAGGPAVATDLAPDRRQ